MTSEEAKEILDRFDDQDDNKLITVKEMRDYSLALLKIAVDQLIEIFIEQFKEKYHK